MDGTQAKVLENTENETTPSVVAFLDNEEKLVDQQQGTAVTNTGNFVKELMEEIRWSINTKDISKVPYKIIK